MDEIEIRLIEEGDVQGVARLYRDVYGDDYPFKDFYDTRWIKRGVFDSTMRWYVAAAGERLLGSAAVMLAAGDADDSVAELGRLVVHPDARGQNLGGRLVDAVVQQATRYADFTFAECRTAHVGSQLLLGRAGFAAVGIEPLAYQLDDFETVVLACRLTEGARMLRKASPEVIPEVAELGSLALAACDLEPDLRVDEAAAPYPRPRDGDGAVLEPMVDAQRYRLLRLGRSRWLRPEVFGAFRLESGLLKLGAVDARHVVLQRGGVVLGGLGYTWNAVERKAHVFELVGADDQARGAVLGRALESIEETLAPRYLSIDVSAHATRLQRTLLLHGFAPVAYMPSMVYVIGERFDVVRFVKLRQEPKLEHWTLIDSMRPICAVARQNLLRAARGTTVDAILRGSRVLRGLSDVELRHLASVAHERSHRAGEVLFRRGDADQSLFVVLDGEVEVLAAEGSAPEDAQVVAVARAGETLGEMALLEELPRSADARARTDARLLCLSAADFDELIEQSPRAGVKLLRNLAELLSERLRRGAAARSSAEG